VAPNGSVEALVLAQRDTGKHILIITIDDVAFRYGTLVEVGLEKVHEIPSQLFREGNDSPV